MNTLDFGSFLKENGFCHFAGVPCSYLSPFINWAINENAFMMANNEGDALAMASGVSLMKAPHEFGVVLMQNSGLTNAISPLTSLNAVFHLPVLGFVSLRGEEDEKGNNTDEPQHEWMGKITEKMLHLCNVETDFLSSDFLTAQEQLQRALRVLKTGKSFFFIVRKNVFEKLPLKEKESLENKSIQKKSIRIDPHPNEALPGLVDALKIIQEKGKQSLILASTGFTARALFDLKDLPNQFYMVGSMGCVSALALGVSLKTPLPVVAIDGDSALLMRLGALPANACYAQNRAFCHIVLNNGCHLSTGGQKNLSPQVDFAQVAHCCGYPKTAKVHSLTDFAAALDDFYHNPRCTFIELKTNDEAPQNLSRPNVTPPEVARRFQKWAKG